MKKYIIYLSVLFISLANNALADRYYTNPAYTNPAYQLNKNTSVRHYDYIQDSYNRNRVIRPYIGIDGFYSDFRFAEQQGFALERPGTYFKDNSFGLAGIVGVKFHKYFGIEGFYRRTFEESKVTRIAESDSSSTAVYDVEGKTLLSAYGADLLAFLPIENQLDLLASVGVGQYTFKTTIKDQISIASIYNNYIANKKTDTTGLRIGAGLQYNIKEELYMRGMVRFVKMCDDDYIKHLVEVSLGLYYMF